jgi:hypothetical protein
MMDEKDWLGDEGSNLDRQIQNPIEAIKMENDG